MHISIVNILVKISVMGQICDFIPQFIRQYLELHRRVRDLRDINLLVMVIINYYLRIWHHCFIATFQRWVFIEISWFYLILNKLHELKLLVCALSHLPSCFLLSFDFLLDPGKSCLIHWRGHRLALAPVIRSHGWWLIGSGFHFVSSELWDDLLQLAPIKVVPLGDLRLFIVKISCLHLFTWRIFTTNRHRLLNQPNFVFLRIWLQHGVWLTTFRIRSLFLLFFLIHL